MPLTAGSRLGPYEVVEPLGAGGMGEVYKARDTRLERLVAIKVLPDHLSGQPENRERFEREARAISALNHPNICTLHDVGQHEGIGFLVMEYLEGETLSARLMRGPIPLDESITIAIQIASALDRAHRHGIVHRDLKPGNVMLTKSTGAGSGPPQAKLLDFGLAKLNPVKQAVGSVSMLPTAPPSNDLTGQGTLVGTLQYMAPEQLEGREADARTDIFAFGALVYEMVTGQKAFQGKSQASLISSIMSAKAPSIAALQTMSPPALDHLVATCLAKDPADRWQTAHDVMTQLKWIAEGGSQLGVPVQVVAARRSRSHVMIGLLVLAAALVAAMSVPTFRYFRGTPPADPVRFNLTTVPTANYGFLAVSPDGQWIALQGTGPSGVGLFIRRLDSTVVQAVSGTQGATSPFWSPDGRYLAFLVGNRLKRMIVPGGAPEDLGEAEGPFLSWGTRDTILFTREGRFHVLPASGGQSRPVDIDAPNGAEFPYFLPDGNHFLYTAPGARAGIYVGALDSKAGRLLIEGTASAGMYAEPGFLLFQRQTTLFAQEFNPTTMELAGEPTLVTDDIFINQSGRPAVSVSTNGVMTYRTSARGAGTSQFSWYDRNGKPLGTAGKPEAYDQGFDLSPDGRQVAVSIFDPAISADRLWILDWARGVTAPLTFTSSGRDLVWSPDGLRIAYSRTTPDTAADILEKKSSGLGEEQVVLASPTADYVEDWSKDNRYILYSSLVRPGLADIWALPLFDDRKPFPVVTSPFTKDEPHVSFDGKWLAYASTESGNWQIYVISFPAGDQKRQISSNGGSQPRWNRDGKELYYLGLDGKMMMASITAGATLDSGIPQPLFETGIQISPTLDQYAVTPDGQRFLLLKGLTDSIDPPLAVVVNWTQMLKQ